jgi:hypothetical protein
LYLKIWSHWRANHHPLVTLPIATFPYLKLFLSKDMASVGKYLFNFLFYYPLPLLSLLNAVSLPMYLKMWPRELFLS